jgi:hypothetical protein
VSSSFREWIAEAFDHREKLEPKKRTPQGNFCSHSRLYPSGNFASKFMGAKAADDDHIPMIQPETGGASGPGPAAPRRRSEIVDRGWRMIEPPKRQGCQGMIVVDPRHSFGETIPKIRFVNRPRGE